jgi:hypothetical protein
LGREELAMLAGISMTLVTAFMHERDDLGTTVTVDGWRGT